MVEDDHYKGNQWLERANCHLTCPWGSKGEARERARSGASIHGYRLFPASHFFHVFVLSRAFLQSLAFRTIVCDQSSMSSMFIFSTSFRKHEKIIQLYFQWLIQGVFIGRCPMFFGHPTSNPIYVGFWKLLTDPIQLYSSNKTDPNWISNFLNRFGLSVLSPLIWALFGVIRLWFFFF